MKTKPIVSVVVPVCNVEKYVAQCINSITSQTLKNIEIICVDDGSKDESLSIMKNLAKGDSRITVIEKPNTGYGNSVNIGLSKCAGDYIAIIESDDFIDSHMFEDLINLSKNGSVDIVKGNFWDFYDAGKGNDGYEYVNTERCKISGVNEVFCLKKYPELLWGHPSIWSALYRRDFLEENKIKFMEVPGAGWVDNPFFFETLYLAKSIRWTSKPYYHYRKTNMNSSSNRIVDLTLPMRRMMDNLDVLEKYNCNDEAILKIAYARALAYLRGVFFDKNWGKQIDAIRYYGHKMMLQLKESVILNNFNEEDKKLYYDYLSPMHDILPVNGKVLIYNWIQFDNPENYGGGVNIYCHNLIDELTKERPDIQIYFLSSGTKYEANTTDCFIRTTFNKFGNRCRSFEVVNSPVPAAQNLLLNNPTVAFENKVLKNVVKDFLKECGPFNAIHFNNIEGLSLDVLDLKKDFPETKFIYSAHNYVPFCVTGFYFMRNTCCNCNPNHSAEECLDCTSVGRRFDLCNEVYARATSGLDRAICMPKDEWLEGLCLSELDKIVDPKYLEEFCSLSVNKINQNIDCVLAVAERVKELCLDNGFDSQKIVTSYIGTKVAEFQTGHSQSNDKDYLKIAYLGSDATFPEKGYPFLMDALESLEDDTASKIDLFLTTVNGNIGKMKSRLKKYHSVVIKQGYKHSELREMLIDVDLGVIPVLWEDNLPQISIEMVAMGVPVLCSSFGGASELCSDDLFKFDGGNKDQLLEKIRYFVDNKTELKRYWDSHNGLVTMERHVSEILKIYDIPSSKEIVIDADTLSSLNKCYNFGFECESDRTKDELYAIKNSKAYKFGEKVAQPVRLMRKVFNCYKDNGLRYTVKKVISKL